MQSVLSLQNSNLAKGQITDGYVTADIINNSQVAHAADVKPLVVGYKNGAAIRVADVAEVVRLRPECPRRRLSQRQTGDSRSSFSANRARTSSAPWTASGPNLNSIKASIPLGINMTVVLDRTTTIRASVADVERTLVISIVLVIIVVFVFLRNGRATLIPGVAVPVSLIGTCAVMYLCGYSLDNLVA